MPRNLTTLGLWRDARILHSSTNCLDALSITCASRRAGFCKKSLIFLAAPIDAGPIALVQASTVAYAETPACQTNVRKKVGFETRIVLDRIFIHCP